MFESIAPDPGQDALARASRIFYVIAVLIIISSVLFVALALGGDGGIALSTVGVNLLFAGAAVATGKGIENGKAWAKWAGIVLGLLELLNFPIGTVIGVAILVYLNRAIKAGLFKTTPSPAA